MKRINSISLYLLISILLLSACGSGTTPAPTISVDDMQSTAFAAALTVIAETHAAQPTDTSLPPTSTPTDIPTATETPSPAPTAEALNTNTPEPTYTSTSTPTVAAANDSACNNILGASAAKKFIRLRLWNKSRFPVSITVYLNKTEFGDCGYRAYSVPKGSQILITDLPFGCYNATAFINDPKGSRSAFASGCANNTDVWSFEILNDSMVFAGP